MSKERYDACSLFPNKDNPYDRDIIELRIGDEKKHGEQIDGQINLFDSV